MKNGKALSLRYGSAICAVLIGLSGHAQAQITDSQRSIVDPTRAGESIREKRTFAGNAEIVDVKDGQVLSAPAGAEKVTFVLNDLAIEGVTAYDAMDISSLYEAKLGQSVSLKEVYGIAEALTRRYRNDGYILTRVIVPPQRIEKGNVRLRVVEGYVSNIEVRGDEVSAMSKIRQYAARMQLGGVLNTSDLERSLLLINDLPGVSARSVLSPSQTEVGAADMTIIVERDKFDGLVKMDNHGSRYLGPIQMSAAASANSVFGYNEKLTGQVVFAPDSGFESELSYFNGAIEVPIFNNGTTIEVMGSYAHTKPGFDLSRFIVRGRSRSASVTLSHPLIRRRSLTVETFAKLDIRDVDSSNALELTRRDRLTVARAGTNIEFVDRLWNVGVNTLNMVLSRGTGWFGATDENASNKSRAAANPSATTFSMEVQRLQRVTDKVNVLVAMKGQLASNALLSSEEFGVGGSAYGRGYDGSEVVGDDGVAGKFEIQWSEPKKLELLDTYQLYAFYDVGRVWNKDATTSDLKRESLASTGIGARLNLTEGLEAGFMIARPLTRDQQTSREKDWRGYFNVGYRF